MPLFWGDAQRLAGVWDGFEMLLERDGKLGPVERRGDALTAPFAEALPFPPPEPPPPGRPRSDMVSRREKGSACGGSP